MAQASATNISVPQQLQVCGAFAQKLGVNPEGPPIVHAQVCGAVAIKGGVKKVFIINGEIPHALLIELLTDEGLGTMFSA